jgi:nucleoside phosphorylase
MGRLNAAAALDKALRSNPPELVLTCGFAGGLKPNLSSASILFAADPEACLDSALEKLGASKGSFHCAGRIATTAAEKLALWKTTGADAVEMESGVIRQICQEHNIPSATIRVISDATEVDLPLDFNELLTVRCELAYSRLFWRVVTSPSSIPGLIRLQRQSKAAAKRLGALLAALLSLPMQRNRL